MNKPFTWKRPDTEPSREDWIRLAAFIDGEGSILITERNYKHAQPGMYLRVVICNTDPRLPVWCKETFGGVFCRAFKSPKRPTHRQSYKWHASTRHAQWILENCLEHFLLKREQAELALEFRSTVKVGRHKGLYLPEGIREKRIEIKQKLHELRWKTVQPTAPLPS